MWLNIMSYFKLEQLEWLHSEDTPCSLMITNLKNLSKFQIPNFDKTITQGMPSVHYVNRIAN